MGREIDIGIYESISNSGSGSYFLAFWLPHNLVATQIVILIVTRCLRKFQREFPMAF